jgi:hypothetical protein
MFQTSSMDYYKAFGACFQRQDSRNDDIQRSSKLSVSSHAAWAAPNLPKKPVPDIALSMRYENPRGPCFPAARSFCEFTPREAVSGFNSGNFAVGGGDIYDKFKGIDGIRSRTAGVITPPAAVHKMESRSDFVKASIDAATKAAETVQDTYLSVADSQVSLMKVVRLCSMAGVEIDELAPLSTHLEEAEKTTLALTQMCMENVRATERLRKTIAVEDLSSRGEMCFLASKRDAFRQLQKYRMSRNKSIEKIVDIEERVKLTKVVEVEDETVKEEKCSYSEFEEKLLSIAGKGAAVVGGVGGMIAGSTFGAAIGVVPAVFTFGLSIPFGAALGGKTGLSIGSSFTSSLTKSKGKEWLRSRSNCTRTVK